jgi:hypothetical protein
VFDRTLVLGLSVLLITGAVLLVFRNPRVHELFVHHVPDHPRRRLLLAAIGFFLTFSVARTLAYSNYHHIGPFHDIYIHGRRIHHFVWGILLLLAVGFGWLVELGTGSESSTLFSSRAMALLYGAGAALTLDEFALWLNLTDVYWAHEGRASLHAIILFGVLLVLAIWGREFARALVGEFFSPRKRSP